MKVKILSIIVIVILSIQTFYAQILKVDSLTSKVIWQGTMDIGGHNGTIAIKEGFVEMKKGKLVGGKIIIDMKGITIIDADGVENEKHIIKEISGNQFFNVGTYSTAKFEITENVAEMLTGNLTLNGITKPVKFKIITEKAEKKIIINSILFPIDLLKWGLNFNNWFKGKNLGNALSIQVHIETN